jgi:hypothetical protein
MTAVFLTTAKVKLGRRRGALKGGKEMLAEGRG